MAKISLIGAGNLAWHLAKAFETAGHSIQEVYSRSINQAEAICDFLYNAQATNSLNFGESSSELFILAVSDDAITLVSEQLILPHGVILAHTSGAKSIADLQPKSSSTHKAIFYPLMTFTKGVNLDFSAVPICLEAEEKKVAKYLKSIAKSLSKTVVFIDEKQRLALHIAAVFSSNFANHFWALSKEILELEQLDFQLLRPLVQETLNKAFNSEHPAQVQTGPAIRQDIYTLAKHKAYLKDEPHLAKLYKVISEQIDQWHNEE